MGTVSTLGKPSIAQAGSPNSARPKRPNRPALWLDVNLPCPRTAGLGGLASLDDRRPLPFGSRFSWLNWLL
jgi:hypothetical protein